LNKKININFVGDIMLGEVFENYKRGVKSSILKKKINPFEYCINEFEKSDLNIANLECVLSNFSNREMPFSELLRIPTCFVEILKKNKINVLNLANNHTLDHGIEAFNEMYNILNDHGIKTFGISINDFFQTKPLIVKIKGTNIGFFGYNLSNISDDELYKRIFKIIEIIRKERKSVDILVLSLHFGYEYSNIPAPKFVEICKKLIKEGTDILYGHHSHQLQGVLKYEGKIFAPSLGNFIFDNKLRENRLTAILKVTINPADLRMNYEINPYYINDDFQPQRKIEYLPKVNKLNCILKSIVNSNYKSEKKWHIKANMKSQLGHLKNRIRMRLMFIFHINNYNPYILKIIKNKIKNGKLF